MFYELHITFSHVDIIYLIVFKMLEHCILFKGMTYNVINLLHARVADMPTKNY